MKVLLYGKFGAFPTEIESLVSSFPNLEIVKTNPERIITYGGDGTFIGSERDFPEIPKLYLKNSDGGFHASKLSNNSLLDLLAKNQLKIVESPKLEATAPTGHSLLAMNDIVVRNSNPVSALRFTISSNLPLPTTDPVYVGDGIVVATPFGSSGYFFSITKKTFNSGFGLALNNIHSIAPNYQSLVTNFSLAITITRGPGLLLADNNPEFINLKTGDRITIQPSLQTARLLTP
jgi:NAD+ kinase